MEWLASSGGGAIIDDGVVTLDNPDAVDAVERSAAWIASDAGHPGDATSPPDAITTNEDDAYERFEARDALFMRNWMYAFERAQQVPGLADDVGVALLPAEPGEQSVGALGGWNLGVAADAADPTAAARFIAFLASEAEQRERAVQHIYLPALTRLYDETAVASLVPTLDIRSALENVVPRPCDDVGTGSYDAVSEFVYGYVHDVLEGDVSASDALSAAQSNIEDATGLPWSAP